MHDICIRQCPAINLSDFYTVILRQINIQFSLYCFYLFI